jgi:hypothetical protein
MNGAEPLSVKAARRWAEVYTRGLSADLRERRRLELESDMWEHLHDADEPNAANAVFGRFLRGIPADVRWRYRTLLESRGARQRSQHMTTSLRSNWWVILTAILGVLPLGISIAMLASGVGGGGTLRFVGVAVSALTGALLIGGLIRRETDLIAGSQLILAGAAATLVGGLEFIPVGIIVLVSGFWTGNLQLSEATDGPELRPVRDQQVAMTRYWYLWLAAAAALFAIGWLPLIFDDPNDLSFGGWLTWVLTWLAAIVIGGIGAILAGLRLTIRHRTRLPDAATSQAT